MELFIPDFSKTPKLNFQCAYESLRKKIFYDLILKYYHVCSLFCQYCDSYTILWISAWEWKLELLQSEVKHKSG